MSSISVQRVKDSADTDGNGSVTKAEASAALAGQEHRAAEEGLTLVSGNARGADRTAQEACLAAGGRVISIVADELSKQARRRNLLYLSEDDFDGAFSTQRALSRNRCIHALGRMVFVAQSDFGHGGTWDGTVKNLRFGWRLCLPKTGRTPQNSIFIGISVIRKAKTTVWV